MVNLCLHSADLRIHLVLKNGIMFSIWFDIYVLTFLQTVVHEKNISKCTYSKHLFSNLSFLNYIVQYIFLTSNGKQKVICQNHQISFYNHGCFQLYSMCSNKTALKEIFFISFIRKSVFFLFF